MTDAEDRSPDARDVMPAGGAEPMDISDEMFRAMVDAAVSPFVMVDSDGLVRWAGRTIEALVGVPAAELIGRHFFEFVAPSSHEAVIAAFTAFNAGPQQPWRGPPMLVDLLHPDGSLVMCEVSASRGSEIGFDGAVLQVRRWRGALLLYEAVDAIVGGRPLDDVLLRVVELVEHDLPGGPASIGIGWDGRAFRSVFHHPVDGPERELVRLAPDDGDEATDDAAAEALGRGRSPWSRALADDEMVCSSDLGDAPEESRLLARTCGIEACWAFPIHVGPEERPTAALVIWRRLPGAADPYLAAVPRRVARLVALAIEADQTRSSWQRAARVDDLTGLPNRPALMEHLGRVAAQASPAAPCAVLFCDLDDFKPVNDEHGHNIGDRVLASVAQRIGAAVGPTDLAARWGGDEFAVVCSDGAHEEALVLLAERLIEVVNQPITFEGIEIHIGLTVGIASTTAAVGGNDLLCEADEALRSVKREGKNRWRHGAAGSAPNR